MSRQSVTVKKCSHPRYSWRVTFNQGEEYAQKYFVTKADAKSFADEKTIELLNEGRKHADFSDVERKAVIRCREMVESFAASGVKGFCLDAALTFYASHLNLCGRSVKVLTAYDEFLEHKPKKKRSQLHLRDIRYRLEKFAKKHGVFLIVVAHPAKMRPDKEGKIPVPTLYDISDSAHWNNKADVGIVIHREESHTICRVAKVRYHEIIGTPADVIMTYDYRRNKFEVQL